MANVYNNAKELWFSGDLFDMNSAGITYNVLLLRTDGTFGPAVFDPDDVTVTNLLAPATMVEVTVSGYSRQTMTTPTVTQDDTNDRANVAAPKVTFQTLGSGQDVGAAIVYKEIGTDGQDLVISFYLLTNTPTNGGDIEIRWDGVDGTGDFIRMT